MLSKNIIANYASQIYVTIIGIILLPMYIKYMGSEAYGLVGFFTMLQAWFNILDLGLTPTIARETARYRGKVVTPLAFRQLFRSLSVIFFFIAFLGCGTLILLSEIIAIKWLNIGEIPALDVIVAVKVMAICVALRWITGLYRGVITGTEEFVWLSVFNCIIVTLRFVGVFISMWFFGFTPFVFFIHQLIIASLEILGLGIKARKLLPNKQTTTERIGWSFSPVKKVLKFSLTIAFTASVWVFVTQIDKLVLSGILPLGDYGYFTLAVLVANGIMVIGGPISSAIMPRMSMLHSEGKHQEMINVYRQSTQLVAIIAGSAAITLITTAKQLLIAWTGQPELADKATTILRLYAAGNLFLSIAAFGYYLQYAKGNLRYHFIGNIALAVTLIPSIIIAAMKFGGVGAGYVWLIINALFLFFWVAYIHHKLEPKLHFVWLWNDVIKILLPASFVGFCLWKVGMGMEFNNRLMSFIFVIVVGLLVISVALLSSGRLNQTLKLKKSFKLK